MNVPATLDAVISSLGNVETQTLDVVISRYTTTAGFVVLLYDFLLTLPDEVRLIWPGSLTFPEVLYYINRYASISLLLVANYHLAGFRPMLPDQFCKVWLLIAGTGQIVTSISSTALLCLRVTALYAGCTRTIRTVWVLFFMSYSIGGIFALISTVTFFKTIKISPITRICLPDSLGTHMSGIFLGPIAFEVLVVVLTLTKAYQEAILLRNESQVPILYTLIRDGFLYFVVVVTIRVWNSIVWLLFPASMLYLGLYADWAIVSTLISRIFLNLRSAVHQDPLELSSQAVGRFTDDGAGRVSMAHGEQNEER